MSSVKQIRVELLDALHQLSRLRPQWRLGQLIANLAGWANQEVWEVEDEQLLAVAREHLDQQSNRAASA